MNWKGHLLFSVVLTMLVLFLLYVTNILYIENIFFIPLIIVFSSFSSLFPDLDHDTGKLRKIMDKLSFPIALIISYSIVCSSFSCAIEEITKILLLSFAFVGIYFSLFTYLKPKHRGPTHSLLFLILYSLLLYLFFDYLFAFAGFLGYASHLIADRFYPHFY